MYIDLLATRTGESTALSLQKDLEAVREKASKRASVEPGAQVEVARIDAHLKNSQRAIIELREQAARASTKLCYLLGVDPSLTLFPVDERLVALNIIDSSAPATVLDAN